MFAPLKNRFLFTLNGDKRKLVDPIIAQRELLRSLQCIDVTMKNDSYPSVIIGSVKYLISLTVVENITCCTYEALCEGSISMYTCGGGFKMREGESLREGVGWGEGF